MSAALCCRYRRARFVPTGSSYRRITLRPGEELQFQLRQDTIGRLKATFFPSCILLGGVVASSRRTFGLSTYPQNVTLEEQTPYGQKYSVRATLIGPSERSADVVSVWFVRAGEDVPRFVTASPEVGR